MDKERGGLRVAQALQPAPGAQAGKPAPHEGLSALSIFTLIAAVFLATLACASTVRKENVKFRALANGSMPALRETAPRVAVISDATTYRKTWDALVGTGAPPAVDFAKESVVFLFAGERRTGGHSLDAKSVDVAGTKAMITAASKGPGRGSAVIQVLTYPYAVIAIPEPKLASATWLDAAGNVVASEDRTKK